MVRYYLPASTKTVQWGVWDARIPPVMHIKSGDSVTIDTLSGEPEDLPADASFNVLDDHRIVLAAGLRGPGPHMLSGPIAVEGAEPGDVLEVRIDEIELRQDWGWNLQKPLHGTLPDEFAEERRLHLPIDIAAGTVTLPWGRSMTCRPFFGNIGVAPPKSFGRLSSVEPRMFGGNIDNKEFVAGTTILFPVFVPGAHFSVGDGHALQGDGEVCLTAVETALRGTFTIRVQKNRSRALPVAITETSLISMGFHPSLDNAAEIALREMISLIVELSGLSRQDAYTLCSIAADLRITQTVDREKGVHCVIARQDLPKFGEEIKTLSSFV
ncbi:MULTISPECIES: acetamidase/formamidase family protein [unclassified Mesorhizobium]|uniref:acetamidase/formamidase family protein n=1 Tax=unclassified Mesorhizobium TaxID=325217 RepID=UPI00112ABD2E|nr:MULTISPECIES: acetamidase/formamidase family protein [unclassified Mesorhizobium]MBZ9810998.1 acetamidase/formamidase family protein [Mesorhizobium sp. ESP-6-2]TPM27860.1 amidase [Mesorhizobium sp. B2-2-2]